jgi:hypothetical protein
MFLGQKSATRRLRTMKKAYVVLGMHRSGTSSVAGVLALLGAAAPKSLMGPAADNPKGFWESYAVSELNDRILATGDSNWADWRAFPQELSDPFRGDGVRLLRSEFDGADVIVLKDPRACRLYPFWREVLSEAGYSPAVLCPIRHPAEVQASLTYRNGMASEDGVRLWLRHVLDAERFSRDQPRLFMLWSDFLTDWRAELGRMSGFGSLDLLLNDDQIAGRISEFLSQDLHHHRHDDVGSDSLDGRVFKVLSDLARRGETSQLVGKLEGLRDEFEAACRATEPRR